MPSVWLDAWLKGMRDRGYPLANITIDVVRRKPSGQLVWGYTWIPDLDAYFREDEPSEAPWIAAHEVFAAIDHLRPPAVEPSLMLLQFMLNGGKDPRGRTG